MKEKKGCACPLCVPELTKGCFSPGFCKPCGISKNNAKVKICRNCKAQYSAEYDECPSCAASKNDKSDKSRS